MQKAPACAGAFCCVCLYDFLLPPYLVVCFNEAVVTVTALINYVYLSCFIVLEYEELVIEQVHLHNRFLGRHRLDGKLLAANSEFNLFLKVLACVDYAALKRAAAKSFSKACLVLAYLSFNDVHRFIKRISEGFILNLATEDSA